MINHYAECLGQRSYGHTFKRSHTLAHTHARTHRTLDQLLYCDHLFYQYAGNLVKEINR